MDKLLFSNKNIYDGFNNISKIEHNNMLSMMLETEATSGKYILEERSSWPTNDYGYVFNLPLSKCDKGSQLRRDEENNMVVMIRTTSDNCYVYFDIYVEITILLADYVKLLYTGTQRENNLYYHDSTLTNIGRTWVNKITTTWKVEGILGQI